jgi:hypothetical protein
LLSVGVWRAVWRAQVSNLQRLLPEGPVDTGHMDTDEDDHHDVPAGMSYVDDINEELKGRVRYAKGVGGEAYDEDDDDDDMPRGAQRVQCAQS